MTEVVNYNEIQFFFKISLRKKNLLEEIFVKNLLPIQNQPKLARRILKIFAFAMNLYKLILKCRVIFISPQKPRSTHKITQK